MASGIEFNVAVDLKPLQDAIRFWHQDQVPFASALALTRVAGHVADAETGAIASTFNNPTPFTRRAIGVKPATKSNLTATVFVRDIQEKYLEPYLDPMGGKQVLGSKKAILTPIQVALNQYGNIPRGKLQSLKGRPGIFIGRIKTKKGAVISGVWQRPMVAPVAKGRRASRFANTTGHLKLLIEFTDPKAVKQNLAYEARAAKVINATLVAEFAKAIAQAIATAR